jgi:hypothetical protein
MAWDVASRDRVIRSAVDLDEFWNDSGFQNSSMRMLSSTPEDTRGLHHKIGDLLQSFIEKAHPKPLVLLFILHLLSLLLLLGSILPGL